MGVARLARWIMERYPQAVRNIRRNTLRRRIDNLYIDFNGLIHESLVRSALTKQFVPEDVLFKQITSYLDEIIMAVRPAKTIFISVDGSAPDAKIRQQRQRRIMGQLTAQSEQYLREVQGWQDVYQCLNEMVEKYIINDGCATTANSANITPGTSFMRRVSSYMVAWAVKMQDLKTYGEGVEIIYSGPNVPGEGEHKIMAEIRKQKSNVNIREYIKQEVESTTAERYIGMTIREQVQMHMKNNNIKVGNKFKLQDEKQQDGQHDAQQDEPKEQIETQSKQCDQQKYIQTNLQSNVIFGMDGDLILLSLGLNVPEVYLMRRWQGISVQDYLEPQYSKLDPLAVGLIYLDIQVIREGIIIEMLQDFIQSSKGLANLYMSDFIQKGIDQPQKFNEEIRKIMKNDAFTLEPITEYLILKQIVFSNLADRLIKDFIALTLFIGNDFLPEVPGLSIKLGALDTLISFYKQQMIKSVETGEAQFNFLLNEQSQINLNYISQMFDTIGRNCEPSKIIDDIRDFLDLKRKVESQGRDLDPKKLLLDKINVEYSNMTQEIDPNLLVRLNKSFLNNAEEYQKQQIIQYYKKIYYEKFQRLDLQYQIRRIERLTKKVKNILILHDEIQNFVETEQTFENKNVVQKYLDQYTESKYYYGFHMLARQYLKTLQWVLNYYLTQEGCVQWNWEFPYPFTPLCSDMAIFCRLYDESGYITDVIRKQSQIQNDDDESDIEDQVNKQQQPNADQDDLIDDIISNYKGPVFRFKPQQPKSSLLQLLFTADKSQIYQLFPKFVLDNVDMEFFNQQKSFMDIEVLNYSTPFQSFNQFLNLKQMLPSTRRDLYVTSYGYQPNYSIYYKNYPLGLVDGVEFHQLEKSLGNFESKCTEEQKKYIKAVYQTGSNIIIAQESGGMQFNYKADEYDLDYSKQFQHEQYKGKPSLSPNTNPILLTFKSFFDNTTHVKNAKIYSENVELTKDYLMYDTEIHPISEKKQQQEVKLERFRGPHLIKEQNYKYEIQRIKLDIVAQNVYGTTLTIDLRVLPNNNNTTMGKELYLTDNQNKECNMPQKLSEIISDHIQVPKENLTKVPLVSYYNDQYGYIAGVVANDKLYMLKQNGTYADQTSVLQNLYSENKKKQVKNITTILRDQAHEYTEHQQGTYFNANEPIILICNDLSLDPGKFDEKEFLFTLLCYENWLDPYFRKNMCIYQQWNYQPVPLSSLHRKATRHMLLNSIEELIQEQKHKKHIAPVELHIPEIKLNEEQKILGGLMESKIDWNQVRQQTRIGVNQIQQTALTKKLTVLLPDNSKRCIHLNIFNNRLYQTSDGQINKLAQVCICMALQFFKNIYQPLLNEVDAQKHFEIRQDCMSGQLQVHENVKYPLYAEKINNIVLSYVQYYINTVITPLCYQQFYEQEAGQGVVPNVLNKTLIQYLDQIQNENLTAINEFIEKVQDNLTFNNNPDVNLLDMVYCPARKEFGLIISITRDQYFMLAQSTYHGNPNFGYMCTNVIKTTRQDIVVISQCGQKIIQQIYKQVYNNPDLHALKNFNTINCNLATLNPLRWLSQTPNIPQPKKVTIETGDIARVHGNQKKRNNNPEDNNKMNIVIQEQKKGNQKFSDKPKKDNIDIRFNE